MQYQVNTTTESQGYQFTRTYQFRLPGEITLFSRNSIPARKLSLSDDGGINCFLSRLQQRRSSGPQEQDEVLPLPQRQNYGAEEANEEEEEEGSSKFLAESFHPFDCPFFSSY